ncbi:MAG: hypothetical protein GXP49_04040, partial [Deltaproteobacteria bacterium]|nr:hypothetical protein [Deltaproteobacteria bacterium]
MRTARSLFPAAVCVVIGIASAVPVLSAFAAVVPRAVSGQCTTSVSYDAGRSRYVLRSKCKHDVSFFVSPGSGDVAHGLLEVSCSVDRGPETIVLSKAGTRYRDSSGNILEPGQGAEITNPVMVKKAIEAGGLVLGFSEKLGSHVLNKTFRLSLQGMSLKISFSSGSRYGAGGYAGISLGHAPETAGARVVDLPYLPEPVALLNSGLVMTAFLDPTTSSSSEVMRAVGISKGTGLYSHARTLYIPDTNGRVQQLNDTAYVTVSPDLWDVLPRVDTGVSAYRRDLSGRVVLDVWGMHRRFGGDEGVAVRWTPQSGGHADIRVEYADQNADCGDGVRIDVRHDSSILALLSVANGQTETKTWQGSADLDAGDNLHFEIDRAGDNACDATAMRARINMAGQTFDSRDDFSGTQGYKGFEYLECVSGKCTPMTFDSGDNKWKGKSAYSLLWAGGGHPGQGDTAFVDARHMVERYVEYGMKSLAVIFHVWQRWGYDQGLPDHYPANPSLGTGQEMKDFVKAARDAGMLIALHENYTDMYPDNPPDYPSPLWDETAIALDPSGNRKPGWYQPSTHQQAFIIAADRMRDFSEMESPSIASAYGPNAAYLDVTTGWTPSRAIDYNAARQVEPTMAFSFMHTVDLFDYIRSVYKGPLFGEGGEGTGRFDSYFAGHVDAVERQVEKRAWSLVAPDYELLSVRPLMFNHGMGYYARFFVASGQQPVSTDDVDMDHYRATEIAFGHAGFMGDGVNGVRDWPDFHAPEYWLMQALQEKYSEAGLVSVKYFDGSNFVDLEQALRSRLDLEHARLEITYDNGLKVYLNRDFSTGLTSSNGDFSYEQGGRGWRYYEDLGAGLVELAWDPENRRWQGKNKYSFLGEFGGHPDGGAVIRSFTVPADTVYHVEAWAQDMDLSCGDGVTATVLHQGSTAWRCDLPGDRASPCDKAVLDISCKKGETISLRIDQKANNFCDSTAFSAQISWDDNQDHDWTLDAFGQTVSLPPGGFVAQDGSGFRAMTSRMQPVRDSSIKDIVTSQRYDFARYRGGGEGQVGDYLVDGGIAVIHGTFGDEIHGLQLKEASKAGELLLSPSFRADVNFRIIGPERMLVTVRNIQGS